MSFELKDLFIDLAEDEKKSFLLRKIASLISKISKDSNTISMANEFFSEYLLVDINQLESLVNPNKYDFPEPKIGLIEVEK